VHIHGMLSSHGRTCLSLSGPPSRPPYYAFTVIHTHADVTQSVSCLPVNSANIHRKTLGQNISRTETRIKMKPGKHWRDVVR